MSSHESFDSTVQTLLVIDDELRSRESLSRVLADEFNVLLADSAEQARELLEQHEVAVILCDQRMPGMQGIDFLKETRERWPEVVRIVLSGYTDAEDIIAGVNDAGIYQYLLKPWLPDHLLNTVRNAVESRALHNHARRLDVELRSATPVLRRRNQQALDKVRDAFDFARIVRAPGSPLDALCELAARVARFDLSVLLLGESGTGKELLARAIHYASPRAGNAFIMENCAALPDTLLESELFGHAKGAFSGAVAVRLGRFEAASGGTLLLDEIGEISLAIQTKLLRVLQEREIVRVGENHPRKVDVRVIAATHRDLAAMVKRGEFREDLYYRLRVLPLEVPALRDHREDIPLLASKLLSDLTERYRRPDLTLSAEAMTALEVYDWPGNVRHLFNALEYALVQAEGTTILPKHLLSEVVAGAPLRAAPPATGAQLTRYYQPPGDDAAERALILKVLEESGGNKAKAARQLGMSRTTLWKRLNQAS